MIQILDRPGMAICKKKDFSHRQSSFFFSSERSQRKEYRPRKKEDDILIIQSSSIGTSANRRYQSTQSSYVEHSEWDNATGASFTEACSNVIHITESSSSTNGALNNTSSGYELEELMERFHTYQPTSIPSIDEKIEMIREMRQKAFDYLLQIFFGKGASNPTGSVSSISRTTSVTEASAASALTAQSMSLGENLGTGGSHYSYYYCAERETTCFSTTGTAITADGKSLSFNISVEMSRSFTEMAEEKCDFGQPKLCDPLVINLNTNVASVSDQKFFFDIDADSTEEEISMLDSDSGYLALDNNNDGTINDGSELFGTTSGNGFKDLLAYDEDGNGWIDEADSIFQKLKVWSMNEDGSSTLMDLKESGVGAIYLGYEDTKFSLNDAENKTNAVIQKTGMFLYEDGEAGTVQQLDLAVQVNTYYHKRPRIRIILCVAFSL